MQCTLPEGVASVLARQARASMDVPNLSGSCIWGDSLREVRSCNSGVGRVLVIASSAAGSASPCRRECTH